MFAGQLDHLAAEFVDIFAGFIDVSANARADFDDGGVHFSLNALLQAEFALGKHFGFDVGAQIACYRVDGLVFLFNAERERRAHGMTSVVLVGIVRQRQSDVGLRD